MLKKRSAPTTALERQVAAEWARKELALHGIVFSSRTGREYELRGGNRDLVASTDPQVILAGPSDTGKTISCCLKGHSLNLQYPGCQGAIIRKTAASMYGTVLQTWNRITEGMVSAFGGEKPQWYDYANGSRVWVGGMDNPDKVLSSERDWIFVNQTEELTQQDWETISTRTTGRNAVVPHPQLFGDANPAGSKHWIRELAKAGTLRLLLSTHKDNPTIYNTDGSLTASGHARIAALEKLTGLRRKRLFEGVWATAEGAVYDMFNAAIHVRMRPLEEMRRFYLTLDEGFTNPAVILLIGEDSDGRQHCFREFYQTGQLQETVVKMAREWYSEFDCELASVDEAAAGLIADLNALGMRAVGAKGRVIDGINLVQSLLQVAGDGLPRFTLDPGCVNLQNEFESYVWKPEKDVPAKENDHALDALRYLQIAVRIRSPAAAILKKGEPSMAHSLPRMRRTAII